MDKQPVGQLPDLTQSNNDDEIMVITDSEHNQLKKEKISDFITDLTSTDENNAIIKGTDGKLFTKDFGNASNITEGTLPVSVLPDIPKDKLPDIEITDLPESGVTADTYAYPSSVTVNAQGMVTAIAEGTPSGANADTNLSNLTEEGEKHFLNKTQITNCILEVPQRVKLEVSDGTITIKAGSVVIFPYGTEDLSSTYPVGATFVSSNLKVAATQYTNGKFFVWAELQNDVVNNATSDTGSTSIHYDTIRLETGLLYRSIRTESGTAAQASGTYCAYYDTTANIIRTSDETTAFLDNFHLSFPIVKLQADGTYWAGKVLEQYNGMGYIGSSIWLDKDVKVLAANGRNADGSINNIEYTTEEVLLYTNNNTNTDNYLIIRKSRDGDSWVLGNLWDFLFHTISSRAYYPDESELDNNSWYYVEDEAIWLNYINNTLKEYNCVVIGTCHRDADSKISNYNPSNVFCAVDNSKYVRDMAQKADVDLSNCTPANSFINQSMEWLMPDYSQANTRSANTTYTVTTNPGWICKLYNNNNGARCRVYINGTAIQGANGSNNVSAWDSIFIPVGVGDTYKCDQNFTFYCCKGA